MTAGATASAAVTYAATAPLALALQEVASGLDTPTFLTAPSGDSRLFILERPGRIRVMQNGSLLATPFLDISSLTKVTGERGLLSLAFHPLYASNGYFSSITPTWRATSSSSGGRCRPATPTWPIPCPR